MRSKGALERWRPGTIGQTSRTKPPLAESVPDPSLKGCEGDVPSVEGSPSSPTVAPQMGSIWPAIVLLVQELES